MGVVKATPISFDGEHYCSLSALARAYKLAPSVVCNRYRKGLRGSALLSGSPLLGNKAFRHKVVNRPARSLRSRVASVEPDSDACRAMTERLRNMW